MFTQTTATNKILGLTKRIRGVSGGSSASKTISILIWLIGYAQTQQNKLISVVSESFPHLKRGAMRDFQNIMESHNYWDDGAWNKTDYIYTFSTGSKIEFFSADQAGKVRGPRRDILFINEANNIPYETFNQLEIRTKNIIWLDWNPVTEFWFYAEVLPKIDCDFLTLTYKDNEALEESIVQSIESRKHNKMWFQVYGLGQLGEVEGRIFTDWQIIDEIPHEAKLLRYGLDFGFSNDPSVIIAVYTYNGGYIFDEILYKKGCHNKVIADILLAQQKQVLVKADSSEPKSISEIAGYGVMIAPARKGKDSISHGIQYIQQQRCSVTKRSTNLIKEYRNYIWATDINGKAINTPPDFDNHALDAIRYALDDTIANHITSLAPKENTGDYLFRHLRELNEPEGGDSYYS